MAFSTCCRKYTSSTSNRFCSACIVMDDHVNNVSAYSDLFGKYGLSSSENAITHPSNAESRIYLLYDSVYLVKNIRHNLLNAGRFLFSPFEFNHFPNKINVADGEIS